ERTEYTSRQAECAERWIVRSASRLSADQTAFVLRERIGSETELHTDIAKEIALCDNDACFDLDLRFGLIKKGYQLADRIDVLANVRNDKRICAAVDFD